MFFVFCNRNALIKNIPQKAKWAEVGVYRGDFSQDILDLCNPSELNLIDNWKFEIEEHNPFTDTAENFSGFVGKIHWEHFGDDPNATQEQNYQYVKSRFSSRQNVKVIRSKSIEGLREFSDHSLDVIYIDANHQYEYVLRDMMEARSKLRPGGIMLLNDFYEGPGGTEQNLGTIGAANAFVKRYNFQYLAMTHGAYADVALSDDPGSNFVKEFLDNLNNSDLQFIGIPDSIVPSIRYRLYKKRDGALRYLALL